MTLPYDIARCAGKQIDGHWREGCEDCQRRTSPGNPYRQIHMMPPAIECARRIPPDHNQPETL